MDATLLWTVVGVVLVVLGMSAGAMYWAGSLASKVDACVSLLTDIKVELVTKSQQIERLDRRVTHLEEASRPPRSKS